jgi:hypothetical protein
MTEFEMDSSDASWLATTLMCLADLVDPDGRFGQTLSETQFMAMTDPPAVKWDRRDFSQRLRTIADRIEGELPPDAPQVFPVSGRPRK